MSPGPITTIVADFGGVLSSPLAPAFAAAHAQLEIPDAALGAAMVAVAARRGTNPLYDLESGLLTEAAFFALLAGELSTSLGPRPCRPVPVASRRSAATATGWGC